MAVPVYRVTTAKVAAFLFISSRTSVIANAQPTILRK